MLLATNLRNLGELYRQVQNVDSALQMYTEACSLLDRLARENISNDQLRIDSLKCRAIRAALLETIGDSASETKSSTTLLPLPTNSPGSIPEADAKLYAAASEQLATVLRLVDVVDQQRAAITAAQSAVSLLEQLTNKTFASKSLSCGTGNSQMWQQHFDGNITV